MEQNNNIEIENKLYEEIKLQAGWLTSILDRYYNIRVQIDTLISPYLAKWNETFPEVNIEDTTENRAAVYEKLKNFWDGFIKDKLSAETEIMDMKKTIEQSLDDAVYNANEIVPKMY